MLQAGRTAALGIKSQQQRLDNIAHNLANVNTNGYKKMRVDFKDALYSTMERPTQPQEDANLRLGHGSLVSDARKVFTQGSYSETGNETDLYLEGEGFFAVQSPQGQVMYTRDGAFLKSVENTGTYLVTAEGNYVLDVNGNRIRIEGNSFEVSPEGYISQGDETPAYAMLQVVRFPNEQGLLAYENNLYTVTEASGNPQAANGLTEIKQGALEGSNVDLSSEFTTLIRTQKAFAFASRALSMADQMDGTANQLR